MWYFNVHRLVTNNKLFTTVIRKILSERRTEVKIKKKERKKERQQRNYSLFLGGGELDTYIH
jgi:hypothetical protein